MKLKNHNPMFHACAAFVAMLLLNSNAFAKDEAVLPPTQQVGDVTYRSGGIGLDESQAMKAQVGKYSLSVLFIAHMGGKRDVYTSPTHVTLTRSDNTPVLDIEPNGPYLLLNLPAGKYKISASDGQRSRTQAFQILAGTGKHLVFAWPEEEHQ